MTPDRPPSPSSLFDEMLAKNRKQFDALYGGSTGETDRESAPTPPPAPPARGQPAGRVGTASRTPDRLGIAPSDAERFLTDRYGDGWRHEITDQRREGDEVVVLCKLQIDDGTIVKSQFGRAQISSTGLAVETKGTAAGVAFLARPPDAGSVDIAADPEAAAYRAAEQAALAKCAALL